jgi:hypothetical protein
LLISLSIAGFLHLCHNCRASRRRAQADPHLD